MSIYSNWRGWIPFRFRKRPAPAYPHPSSGNPQAERNLAELASSKNWEWTSFRRILIELSRQGPGHYLPSPKRPDFVHLDGLQATIGELRKISAAAQGREVSRAVFVDNGRSSLVISGKTRIGTDSQVKIDMQPESGRERLQMPVLTIHVHPGIEKKQGLSDIDYISFLTDVRQIIMMICYQEGIMFAMKTSVTMIANPERIQPRIAEIRQDILSSWSNLFFADAILAFNKAVCVEFGMTLYRAPASSENTAHRIDVTSI